MPDQRDLPLSILFSPVSWTEYALIILLIGKQRHERRHQKRIKIYRNDNCKILKRKSTEETNLLLLYQWTILRWFWRKLLGGFSNDKWRESIFEIRTLTVSNYRPSCSPIANRSIVSYVRRAKRNISRIGNDTPRGEHGWK